MRQPIEEPAGNPQAESAKVVPEDVLHSSQSEPEWALSGERRTVCRRKSQGPDRNADAAFGRKSAAAMARNHMASGDTESIFAG